MKKILFLLFLSLNIISFSEGADYNCFNSPYNYDDEVIFHTVTFEPATILVRGEKKVEEKFDNNNVIFYLNGVTPTSVDFLGEGCVVPPKKINKIIMSEEIFWNSLQPVFFNGVDYGFATVRDDYDTVRMTMLTNFETGLMEISDIFYMDTDVYENYGHPIVLGDEVYTDVKISGDTIYIEKNNEEKISY